MKFLLTNLKLDTIIIIGDCFVFVILKALPNLISKNGKVIIALKMRFGIRILLQEILRQRTLKDFVSL